MGWRTMPMRPLLGLALLVILLSMTLARGRATMEWGNRRFRAGDPQAAADVYAVRVDTTALGFQASFNLGTALARLGSVQSERYLVNATVGSDSAAAQRGYYNLGHRMLTLADPDADPYTAVPLLAAAMDHFRAALRLDPTDADARWNLSLALQIFGEIGQIGEEGPADPRGEAEVPEEDPEGTQTESREGGAGDDQAREPPEGEAVIAPSTVLVGAQESLVREDPGPLTEDMVTRLLEEQADDTELLIRGLLWSQRPDQSGPDLGGSW